MIPAAAPNDPTLAPYTVAARLEGRGKAHDLDRARRIGGMAAALYRQHYGTEPPRVREFHAGLGGFIPVFAYPPPDAVQMLDRAIHEVEGTDSYVAPPPPPTVEAPRVLCMGGCGCSIEAQPGPGCHICATSPEFCSKHPPADCKTYWCMNYCRRCAEGVPR